MGLNDAITAERIHIGFFGVRNAGKSSVVNAVTGQDLAVVSDVAGTTTDPVRKTMELLPMGPVVIIDTPGIDDAGALGAKRVEKTRRILESVDVAVLVVDATRGLAPADRELIGLFEDRMIPYVVAYNKADLLEEGAVGASSADNVQAAAPVAQVAANDARADAPDAVGARADAASVASADNAISVSAATGAGIHALKELIGHLSIDPAADRPLVSDLVAPGSTVVLVVPVDSAAPKGRIILPQQQTLRDLLDAGMLAYVTRESELAALLATLKEPPALVVTDSQVFASVSKTVPQSIPLTSFSILFARYRGDLALEVRGARKLDDLHDGDKVLIAEGCTHHRQCEDIGTVKMPRWLAEYTHRDLDLEFTAGRGFPDDLSPYALVVHCGACMLNRREMAFRLRRAQEQDVAFVNYGVAIAKMKGILPRVLSPFDVQV